MSKMALMEEEEQALLDEDSLPKDHGDPERKSLPALCDPQRLAHRLLVLALMCFLGFGRWFLSSWLNKGLCPGSRIKFRLKNSPCVRV